MAAVTAQSIAPISTREQIAALMPDASRLLSEEPEMESSLHHEQSVILEKSLERWWKDRHDFFIGVNLSIYFSRAQLKTHDFRGPDVFIALNTERRPRTSWVVWEEDGKYPDVIIELLSDSTAEIDRKIKKEIYQERFRTFEYFWFSVDTQEFAGWQLRGEGYVRIEPDERGWLWSDRLKLYLGVKGGRLRYFTADGLLVPTPEEGEEQERQRAEQEWQRAEQERQRAEQERQRAEQERQRADLLAEKLSALGLDPDSL
mgnify:CR=1 FL=1